MIQRVRTLVGGAARRVGLPVAGAGVGLALLTAGGAAWIAERLLRVQVPPFAASHRVRPLRSEPLPLVRTPAARSPIDGGEEPVRASVGPTTSSAQHVELAGPDVGVAGLWGLRWPGGYARLGQPVPALGPADADADGSPAWVRRPVRVLLGELDDLGEGDRPNAQMCGYAYPPDLAVLQDELNRLSLPAAVAEVQVPSTLGAYPATLVVPDGVRRAAAGATWVVAVHGRGSLRTQVHRMVPVLASAGATTLAITYRGDAGTPTAGRSGLGTSEWHEVEAAVSYALTAGAQRIVLYGFSMGGAVVTAFLRRSALAPAVVALALDAPVLDWGAVLRAAARSGRLPGVLVPLTMTAARLRAGIDFALVQRLLPPERLLRMGLPPGLERRPTLLVHGTADRVVPVAVSDELAEAEPFAVAYLRVDGAGHTTAWNVTSESYDAALRSLITVVAMGPSAPDWLLAASPPSGADGA